MKIGGIVLVILGLLCLPQGLIFIVPGVALFLLSQKRKQAANSASAQPFRRRPSKCPAGFSGRDLSRS